MRKLIYLPQHIKDRLRKYRERNNCEELTALIRLIEAGLKIEEDKLENEKLMEDFKKVAETIRI